jgi:hypothetical protein
MTATRFAIRLRPLMRLEHGKKSGVIFVDFILTVTLTGVRC